MDANERQKLKETTILIMDQLDDGSLAQINFAAQVLFAREKQKPKMEEVKTA